MKFPPSGSRTPEWNAAKQIEESSVYLNDPQMKRESAYLTQFSEQ